MTSILNCVIAFWKLLWRIRDRSIWICVDNLIVILSLTNTNIKLVFNAFMRTANPIVSDTRFFINVNSPLSVFGDWYNGFLRGSTRKHTVKDDQTTRRDLDKNSAKSDFLLWKTIFAGQNDYFWLSIL